MVIHKQVTEEELSQLKEVQTKYYETLVEIGKFEYEKRLMDIRSKHLERELELCFSDLETMTKHEQELKEKLQKKYGFVTIDTVTGEISYPQK